MEKLAHSLKLSPVLIGLFLASLGTDLPEIMNSILSSYMKEGDINVGDSLGSVFAQITLGFGVLPFAAGLTLKKIRFKKKHVGILGISLIVCLFMLLSIVQTGYFSRFNALILLGTYLCISFIHGLVIPTKLRLKREEVAYRSPLYYLVMIFLGFFGLTLATFVIIKSIVFLCKFFGVPKYFISFTILAISTSLPEVAASIAALERGLTGIILGNILGSCIVDASLSIAIGPLFFPVSISADAALRSGVYTLLASFLVVLSLYANKGRLTLSLGLLFLLLYLIMFPYSIYII